MSEEMRRLILTTLLSQGFTVADGEVVPPDPSDKANIRRLYANLRNEKLSEAGDWLRSVEKDVLLYFADGTDISIEHIRPRLELVDTPTKANLFRYACLLWSVPVSEGYGRRLRFLVFDDYNGKLIGLFALGDPVYNIRVRDEWIGWDVETKNQRLYHIMDAYVLGAVPPYSYLLAGKLVALLTTSDEVRQIFERKYKGQTSIIRKVERPPHLVLLTTTSALGRSSIYNRISINGRKAFISVGFAEGWGHFHFSNDIFGKIINYLEKVGDPIVKGYQYGKGPNWRIRVIRRCMYHLGLSQNLLRHGIKREVFIIPLARNAQEFLRGKTDIPIYYNLSSNELSEYFKTR